MQILNLLYNQYPQLINQEIDGGWGAAGGDVILHLLLGYEHKKKKVLLQGKLLHTVGVMVLTVQTAGPIIQPTKLPVEKKKAQSL